MKRISIFVLIALALGAVLIIGGVIALTVVPQLISKEVSKSTYLGFDENGTYNEMTRKWVEPKYALQLQIWVFSINNEAEVINGAYPNFTEKGPYTFVEHQRKVKVRFMDNDTRVLYRNNKTYFYNSTRSCKNCSLNDQVTIPNIVFQVLVDFASQGTLEKWAVELALRQEERESPFIKTTVREMLFDGYKDPLIDKACSYPVLKALCILEKIPLAVGYFYGQNNTDDGEYYIGTGLKDARKLGKVYEYNGQSHVDESFWSNDSYALMINGTDGQLFPPGLSRSKDLQVFVGQIKRSIYLRYKKDVEFRGVPALRFIPPQELYDPTRPENKGFCNPATPFFYDNSTQPDGCLPAGLLDISRTRQGHPRIYLSGSHFYNSPSVLYQNFSGFPKPSAKDDETFLDIEPTTGVITDVRQLTQINVGMVAGNLRILEKMHNMIMPVLWLNETARFDNDTREQLLNSLISLKHKLFILGIACLTIGVLLWIAFLLISIIHKYVMRGSSEGDEQLLVQEESDADDAVE